MKIKTKSNSVAGKCITSKLKEDSVKAMNLLKEQSKTAQELINEA